ncbi:MAG: FkbM family methyltransferase [Lachnospiraceae bacterium]|nr:FkbM family methyltransferase [Lachnospiraceae bacterium]
MTEKYYFPFLTERNEANQFVFTLNELYGRLGDAVSKEVFMCRVMYNLTYDYVYVRKMVDLTDYGKEFLGLLDSYSEQGAYIYGAGDRGDKIFRLYPDKKWIGYLDKKKEGTFNGLPVLSPDELDPKNNEALIFISNRTRPAEIKEELIRRGFDEKRITTWNEWNKRAARDSYFDDSVFHDRRALAEGFFVDAGCFNGNNTVDYLRWMGDESLHVAAFEADVENIVNCKERLSGYENVQLINVGLSDKQEELHFKTSGSSSSFLKEGGENVVKTDTIDHVLQGKRVSFIKMDIEGFEEKALRGASATITEQKPALAISLYHKRDDILTIPKLILELNNNYRFYFRHYFLGSNETVLYAVNEE